MTGEKFDGFGRSVGGSLLILARLAFLRLGSNFSEELDHPKDLI
jgi:hypothetical protein